MTYSVSSWFYDQLSKPTLRPRRTFTVNGSDYSDYVLTWPTIERQWDAIYPGEVVVEAANEDGAFNFFRTDKTKFVGSASLGIEMPATGINFTIPASNYELKLQDWDKLSHRYSGICVEVSADGEWAAIGAQTSGNDSWLSACYMSYGAAEADFYPNYNATSHGYPAGITMETWVAIDTVNDGYLGVTSVGLWIKESWGVAGDVGISFEPYSIDPTDQKYVYKMSVQDVNNVKVSAVSTPLTINSWMSLWTHIAGTYDNNTLRLYINGTLNATASVDSPAASIYFNHGPTLFKGWNAYTGLRYADYRVWDVVRGENEITETMCGYLSGNELGLVFNYKFDSWDTTTHTSVSSYPVQLMTTSATDHSPTDARIPTHPYLHLPLGVTLRTSGTTSWNPYTLLDGWTYTPLTNVQSNAFTVEGWFRSIGGRLWWIGDELPDYTGDVYNTSFFGINVNSGYFFETGKHFSAGSSYVEAFSHASAYDNAWHHLGIVYTSSSDGQKALLVIDGASAHYFSVVQSYVLSQQFGSVLSIGEATRDGSYVEISSYTVKHLSSLSQFSVSTNGMDVQCLRVWRTPRTVSEINSHRFMPLPTAGSWSSGDLLASYTMSEGGGDQIKDTSGYSKTLGPRLYDEIIPLRNPSWRNNYRAGIVDIYKLGGWSSGSGFIYFQTLYPDDSHYSKNKKFGSSIAINSNGSTIFVGRPYTTNSVTGVHSNGSVTVYNRTTWHFVNNYDRYYKTGYLSPSASNSTNYSPGLFGYSIATKYDGMTVVGMPYNDNGDSAFPSRGRISAFTGTALVSEFSPTSGNTLLGMSVAIASKAPRIAFSTPGWISSDGNGPNYGGVYIATYSSNLTFAWGETFLGGKLVDTYAYAGATFNDQSRNLMISCSADAICIGAPFDSYDGSTYNGAVLFWSASTNGTFPTTPTQVLRARTPTDYGYFGFCIDGTKLGAGLVADKTSIMAVGGSGRNNAGRIDVYAYDGTSRSYGFAQELESPNRVVNGFFGHHVAMDTSSGAFLFGTAPNEDTSVSRDTGRTYQMRNTSTDSIHLSEFVELYRGTVNAISYPNGTAELSIIDRLEQLGLRTVGVQGSPVTMSASNLLPSDIFWTLATCYGGLSTVQSTSNPDIDWTSFQAWANVFSTDAVIASAQYEGQTVIEALRRLADYTHSAIVVDPIKLTTHRFSIAASVTLPTSNDWLEQTTSIDKRQLVNRIRVYAGYDATSRAFGISAIYQSSASVNTYGLRELQHQDDTVWYVNSSSAINLAQRKAQSYDTPVERVEITLPLTGLGRQVGDMLIVDDAIVGVVGGARRIMGYGINMNDGTMNFEADVTQLFGGFYLDVNTLDGTGVLL